MRRAVRLGMVCLALTSQSACRTTTKDPASETTSGHPTASPPASASPPDRSAAVGSARAAILDPRVYATPPPPSAQTGNEPPERRAFVVAAMGDSLTDPRSHGGKYMAFLREKCPESRFDNFAKGGEMVNQMRRRFDTDLFGHDVGHGPYTDVIVFGGVNDLYSDETAHRTVEKISRDLAIMYESARSHGARVIALTVAPWGGFKRWYNPARGRATLELNEWIRAQGREGTVEVVVDAFRLLSCGDPERLCADYTAPFNDGIHFGPAGHERLGQALFEAAFSDCR